MPDFDLTVIGSGPGGYVAAIRAARMGARVAILEQDPDEWGGTCLNRGCIPTKTLIQCAEVLHTIRRANQFGISVAEGALGTYSAADLVDDESGEELAEVRELRAPGRAGNRRRT